MENPKGRPNCRKKTHKWCRVCGSYRPRTDYQPEDDVCMNCRSLMSEVYEE